MKNRFSRISAFLLVWILLCGCLFIHAIPVLAEGGDPDSGNDPVTPPGSEPPLLTYTVICYNDDGLVDWNNVSVTAVINGETLELLKKEPVSETGCTRQIYVWDVPAADADKVTFTVSVNEGSSMKCRFADVEQEKRTIELIRQVEFDYRVVVVDPEKLLTPDAAAVTMSYNDKSYNEPKREKYTTAEGNDAVLCTWLVDAAAPAEKPTFDVVVDTTYEFDRVDDDPRTTTLTRLEEQTYTITCDTPDAENIAQYVTTITMSYPDDDGKMVQVEPLEPAQTDGNTITAKFLIPAGKTGTGAFTVNEDLCAKNPNDPDAFALLVEKQYRIEGWPGDVRLAAEKEYTYALKDADEQEITPSEKTDDPDDSSSFTLTYKKLSPYKTYTFSAPALTGYTLTGPQDPLPEGELPTWKYEKDVLANQPVITINWSAEAIPDGADQLGTLHYSFNGSEGVVFRKDDLFISDHVSDYGAGFVSSINDETKTQTITFSGLPDLGTDGSYTFVPDAVSGYAWVPVQGSDTKFTYYDLADVTYTVTWLGGMPTNPAMTLKATADGETVSVDEAFLRKYGAPAPTKAWDESNSTYSCTYENLPKTGFTYSVEVTPDENYLRIDDETDPLAQTWVKREDLVFTITKDEGMPTAPKWTVYDNYDETHPDSGIVATHNGVDEDSDFVKKYEITMGDPVIDGNTTTYTLHNVPCAAGGHAYTVKPASAAGGSWTNPTGDGLNWTFEKETVPATMKVELWDEATSDTPVPVKHTLYVTDPDTIDPVTGKNVKVKLFTMENGTMTDVNEAFMDEGYGWKDYDTSASTSSVYSITYPNLPKCNANGHEYEYTFEPVAPDGYAEADTQFQKTETEAINLYIKTSNLHVGKHWHDADVASQTRIPFENAQYVFNEWMQAGKGKAYGMYPYYYMLDAKGNPIQFDLKLDSTETLENPGDVCLRQWDANTRWSIDVKVYGYIAPGVPSNPYLMESKETEGLSQKTELGSYDIRHVPYNIENRNNQGKLYNNDVSKSTIGKQRGLTIQKEWKDNSAAEASRPETTFRLFRFSGSIKLNQTPTKEPNERETMFDYMSPVSGFDSKTVIFGDETGKGKWTKVEENLYSFEYASNQQLPVYDGNGYKYVYILRENMSGVNAGQYRLVDANDNPITFFTIDENGKTELYDQKGKKVNEGDCIYNLRTGTTNVSYSKSWEAKATQNMKTTVTFSLARRVPGKTDWEVLGYLLDSRGNPMTLADGTEISANGVKPERDAEGNLTGRLVDKDGNALKFDNGQPASSVTDPQTKDFTAEYMSKDGVFTGVPKYDDNGAEYEYMVVETAVSIAMAKPDGTMGNPISLDLGSDSYFKPGQKYSTANGEFTVFVERDPDTGKITNRLQQDVILNLKKHWSTPLDNDQTGIIRVQILRNDQPLSEDELKELTFDSSSVSVVGNYLVMTMSEDKTFIINGLPQYDDNGKEYEYRFVEDKNDIIPSDYRYWGTSFNNERDATTRQRKINQTITNYKPNGGPSIRLVIKKEWKDDGNASARLPVWYAVCYKDASGGEHIVPVKSTFLTPTDHNRIGEENQWYVEVNFQVVDDEHTNARDYYVRELGLGDWDADNNKPQFPVKEVTIGDPKYDGGEGPGKKTFRGITTNDQIYECNEVTEITSGNTFTMTNSRVGTMSIVLTKDWNTGDLRTLREVHGLKTLREADGLTAQFLLKQNGEIYTGDLAHPNGIYPMTPYIPAPGTKRTTLTIANLPKYDENGALFSYTLEEHNLNGEEFKNNEIDCGEFKIISSSSADSYTVGEKRTNDVMCYSFANTRAKTAELSVWKLWRDDRATNRSDIVMQLYRESTSRQNTGVKLVTDTTWNTKVNGWLWKCTFGDSFPLYDSEGYAYEYYVKERIVQSDGPYKSYYYPGNEPVKQTKVGGIQSTIDVLADDAVEEMSEDVKEDGHKHYPYIVVKDQTTSFATGQQGVVVNRYEETINFTGTKDWENIPDWYAAADLPNVYMNVKRTFSAPREGDVDPKLAWDTPVSLPISREADPLVYEFQSSLSAYDEYGLPYKDMSLVEVTKDNEPTEATQNGSTNWAGEFYGYQWNKSADGHKVTNTYVGDPLTLQVTKTWDMSALTSAMFNDMTVATRYYPAVTFELYQYYKFDEKYKDEVQSVSTVFEDPQSTDPPGKLVGKAHLDREAILAADAGKSRSFTLTFHELNADGSESNEDGVYDVSIPMGVNHEAYCFTYYVKEFVEGNDTGNVYELQADSSTDRFEPEDTHMLVGTGEGTFQLTNKYQPQNDDTLTATKEWIGDGDFKSLTRPADMTVTGPVKLELWRYQTIAGQHCFDEQVTNWNWETGEWTRSGDKWTFTFAGSNNNEYLPTYSTTNNRYTYYVREANDADIRQVYNCSYPTQYGMTIQNTLKKVNVNARKQWELTSVTGDVLKTWNAQQQAVLADLRAFWGLTDVQLTFTVSDDQGVTAYLNQNKGTMGQKYPVSRSFSYTNGNLYNASGVSLLANLPEAVFDQDGKPQTVNYSVAESGVFGLTVDGASAKKSDKKVLDIVKDTPSSSGVFTITNKARFFKLEADKAWNDANNQDGYRPQTLDITVTPKDTTHGAAVKKTLNWTPNQTPVGTVTFYYPTALDSGTSKKDFSVWESSIAYYTASYEVKDSAGTSVASGNGGSVDVDIPANRNLAVHFTNAHTLDTVDLSFTKTWDDQSNMYGLRPASVELTLQRKTAGSSWSDVEAKSLSGTDNQWTYTWNKQPINAPKSAGEIYADTKPYTYRVVETAVPGYSASDGGVKTFEPDASGSSASAAITNTLDMTGTINAQKVWEDGSNAYSVKTRPDKLVLTLMQSTDTTPSKTWQVVARNGTAVQTILSGTDDVWEWEVGTLPVKDGEGKTFFYRVNEYPVYGDVSDEQAKAAARNGEVVPTGYNAKHTDVTASKGNTGTIQVTNTVQTRWFQLTKQWTGDDSNAYGLRPDSIVVTLQYRVGTDPYQNFTKNGTPVTFVLSGTNSNIWRDDFGPLPIYDREKHPIQYRAVESPVDKYTTAQNTVDFAYDSTLDKYTATVENSLDKGSVVFSKTVDSNVNGDQQQAYLFTVRLEKPNAAYPDESTYGRTYTLERHKADGTVVETRQLSSGATGDLQGYLLDNGTKAELPLCHGESWTIQEIVHGVQVTVVETDYTEEGFVTYVTKGSVPKNAHSDTVTADKDEVQQLTFANERHLGSYTLTKELAGNGTAAMADEDFCCCLVMQPIDPDAAYTRELVAQGYFKANRTIGSVPFEPVAGATNTLAAEVTVKDGNPLTITGVPYGMKIIAFEHDQGKGKNVVAGLIGRGFTITAKTTGDFEEYKPQNGVLVNVNEASQAPAVRFRNERSVGQLSITKQLEGTGIASVSNDSYAFTVVLTYRTDVYVNDNLPTVTAPDDAKLMREITGQSVTYTAELKQGQSLTLTDVLVGTAYTITEENLSGEGFQNPRLSLNGNDESAKAGDPWSVGGEVEAESGQSTGKTYAWTYTNVRDSGTITLTKQLEGTGKESVLEHEFGFTVTLKYAQGVDVTKMTKPEAKVGDEVIAPVADEENGTLTYAVTLQRDKTLTLTDVLVGTAYTITEDNYQKDGFRMPEMTLNGEPYTPDPQTPRTVSGEVKQPAPDKSENVDAWSYTNTRSAGDLTVSKKLCGNASDLGMTYDMTLTLTYPLGVELPGSFTVEKPDSVAYTVTTGETEEGAKTAVFAFALADDQSLSVQDIVQGVSYELTEADYSGLGYTADIAYNNPNKSISDEYADSIEVTNTRSAGSIGVTKEVGGTDKGPLGEFAFTVVLTYADAIDLTEQDNLPVCDVQPTVGEHTLTYTAMLRDGDTLSMTNILTGTSYAIAEDDYTIEDYRTWVTDPRQQVIRDRKVSGMVELGEDLNAQWVYTNMFIGRVTVEGTKIWNDDSNRDGIRPKDIQIELWRNGELMSDMPQSFSGTGNQWSYSFQNLEKYDETGVPYTYTTKEVPVDGYLTAPQEASAAGEYLITNTHEPETIVVTVRKVWNDKDNWLGLRPTVLHFNVLDGSEIVDTITITAGKDGVWQEEELRGVSKPLLKYEAGKEIAYTVKEYGEGKYYHASDPKQDGSYSFVFTNTLPYAAVTLDVRKTLTGGTLVKDEFLFVLKDKDKKILAETRNDADGKTVFPDLVYLLTDVGKTYTYTVTERNESLRGISYDTREYNISVAVSLKGADEIVCQTEITCGGKVCPEIVFANEEHEVYDVEFTFYKKWSDGNGKHPTPLFELHYPDGSICRSESQPPKLTDAKTGQYTYWMPDHRDYYVTEKPMNSYMATYQNAEGGNHPDETNRAYHMGTITNVFIPNTGDTSSLKALAAVGGVSALLMAALILAGKKKKK